MFSKAFAKSEDFHDMPQFRPTFDIYLMRGLITSPFKLDLRALALMRIGIGLCLLVDLIIRFSDFGAFYSTKGLFPFEAIKLNPGLFWSNYYFSFHLLVENNLFQIALFSISILMALMLIVGYRTKVATLISWILLVSLHNRLPVVLQGGDDYLRLILMWGIFLPWQKHFSLDSKRVNRKSFESKWSVTALLIQISSMYLFSALLKRSEEWWAQGSALYYALSLDQMLKPIGSVLYPQEGVLQLMTWAALIMEFAIPILILFPVCSHLPKLIAVFLIFGLHLGIELTLQVGLFSIIAMAVSLCLLPAKWMDGLQSKLVLSSKFSSEVRTEVSANAFIKALKGPLILFLILIGFTWNIGQLLQLPHMVDRVVSPVARTLRMDQNWAMFAPSVFKDDGWFILKGEYEGGVIDMLTEKEVTYEKPEHVVDQFPNARWRKFGENFIFARNEPIRRYGCQYLLNKWNKEHPSTPAQRLDMIYMLEKSLPNYETEEVRKENLCSCLSDEARKLKTE